jgi:hypothetical protein
MFKEVTSVLFKAISSAIMKMVNTFVNNALCFGVDRLI